MRFRFAVLHLMLVFVSGVAFGQSEDQQSTSSELLTSDEGKQLARETLGQAFYCGRNWQRGSIVFVLIVTDHETAEADLNFEILLEPEGFARDRKLWEACVDQILEENMPPEGDMPKRWRSEEMVQPSERTLKVLIGRRSRVLEMFHFLA